MKQCISCKENLELDKFRIRKSRGGFWTSIKCRRCEYLSQKAQMNKGKRAIWEDKNINRIRSLKRKYKQRTIKEISDSYINSFLFKGRSNPDVTPQLLETIRQVIKIKRLIKLKTKTK